MEHTDFTEFESAEGAFSSALLEELRSSLANVNGAGKLSDNNTERTDIIAFTTKETSHAYTIKEVNPTWDSHVFKAWATMKEKPEVESTEQLTDEQLQQKLIEQGYFEYSREDRITFYRGTDSPDPAEKYTQTTSKGDMTLYAQWDEVVCKITDRYGTLLYIDGVPAVYGTLEAGFEAYNNAGQNTFKYFNGTRATARRIEMLVGEYPLDNILTLERGKTVMLTTAPSTDTDGYAYTGEPGSVCVITRAGCDGSMIENKANLTLMNITLDGNHQTVGGATNDAVVCEGGIVYNSQSSAVLTVSSGATLRNSSVEGNGGAVYGVANTTITLSGGLIENNGATGDGGAVYSLGKVTLSETTITGNSATNGGGIYVGSDNNVDGSLDVSGGTVNANPATGNGGGIYVDGKTECLTTQYSDKTEWIYESVNETL